MDLGLKGINALVTGGSKGIGLAVAELFADEGANVAICARNAEDVTKATAKLMAKGVKAQGSAVDVGESRSAESVGSITPPPRSEASIFSSAM